MIESSEKLKRQFAFELKTSRVFEKRSNIANGTASVQTNALICTLTSLTRTSCLSFLLFFLLLLLFFLHLADL